MIERLPTPWGLVRLGVAPDHPNIKAVSKVYEKIARQPGFRFLGNVEVGRDLEHADLARLYDAVVYSVGAQTDRRLGIPGEDLPGSWAATEFVAWYNGHPDFQDIVFDLSVQAGGRRRQRQRRSRRRTHARAGRGGDRAHRHDGRGNRRNPRLGARGDRDAGAARAGAGLVHDPGAQGARRARRRRHHCRPRGARARARERGGPLGDRGRAQYGRDAGVRGAAAGRKAAPSRAALSRLAGCDPRRGQGRGDRDRAQRARRRRRRTCSGSGDRRARGASLRNRLP